MDRSSTSSPSSLLSKIYFTLLITLLSFSTSLSLRSAENPALPGLPTWNGWQWQWQCPPWKGREEEKRRIREELEQELCHAVNVESIADLEVVLCRMVLDECLYKGFLAHAKGIPALELYNLAEKKNQILVHWVGGAPVTRGGVHIPTGLAN